MTQTTAASSGFPGQPETFDRLMFELSTQFVVVRLDAEELALAIESALRRVSKWFSVTGAAFVRLEPDTKQTKLWFASTGIPASLRTIAQDSDALETIQAGNDLCVTSGHGGAIGETLRADGLEGLIILPLSNEGAAITYLTTWWDAPRPILRAEWDQLRMLGELTLAALQRQESEARQTELEEKLRQAHRLQSLGLLAGGVAHDFNNILTVIRGCAEAATREPHSSQQLSELLIEIMDAADQATSLTRKLLTFGKQSIAPRRPIGLTEALKPTLKLLSRLLRANVSIQLEFSDDPCVVCATTADLEQIVLNLCLNSADAMPQGGVITLRAQRVTREIQAGGQSSCFVELCVSDLGSGMSPDQVARAFDPFFTTKEFGDGAGLGLSVVHGIVSQLKGMVEVDTEPARGTTMRVYLPYVEPEPEVAPISVIHAKQTKQHTILVADDLPSLCAVISRTLRAAGFEALRAHGGEAALTTFQQQRETVSLAVLDVIMPGLGGRQVYEQMLELNPELPVLFVSGYTAGALPDGYLDHPLRGLLLKPFNGEDLVQAVQQLLERAAIVSGGKSRRSNVP